jgi:phosphoglycolate phosphatase
MDGPGRELPLDLVAFDLDGTLVDTAAEIAGTLNDVLGSVGLRPVAEPLVRDWIGNGSRALLIRACMDTTGLTESEVQRSCSLDALLQRYTRCYAVRAGTASRLYPEVGESLRELSACGLALAVVSNREERLARAVLRAHDLERCFDTIVGGDTLAVRKPDPLTLRYCLERHGVVPAHALFVGDSAIDVATARNAGVACWAVTYGYNGGRPVAEAGPDRVIDGLGAVTAASRCRPRSSPACPSSRNA